MLISATTPIKTDRMNRMPGHDLVTSHIVPSPSHLMQSPSKHRLYSTFTNLSDFFLVIGKEMCTASSHIYHYMFRLKCLTYDPMKI